VAGAEGAPVAGAEGAPTDESLIAGLASVVKAPTLFEQAIQTAAEVTAANMAEISSKAIDEANGKLTRIAAILTSMGDFIAKRGLGYALKVCPHTAGNLGAFHTAELKSFVGRELELTLKDEFRRHDLNTEIPLHELIKEASKYENGSELVVIHQNPSTEPIVELTVVRRKAFMKFFNRRFSSIPDKSTPSAICARALDEVTPHYVIEIRMGMTLKPQEQNFWQKFELLVKGLVDKDVQADAKKEASEAVPAPQAGDAVPAPKAGNAEPAAKSGDAEPSPKAGNAEPSPKAGNTDGASVGASPVRRNKDRGANKKQNAAALFEEVKVNRSRQTEADRAKRLELSNAAPKAPMNADEAMLVVATLGAANAAAPSKEVLENVKAAKTKAQAAEEQKKRRQEQRMKQLLEARDVIPVSSGDPVFALVASFINCLADPKSKAYHGTREKWLMELETLKEKLKGRKSIVAKLGKFLVEHRMGEVKLDWAANWKPLREEVAALANKLTIESKKGFDSLSAFCCYLNENQKFNFWYLKLATYSGAVDAIALHFTAAFSDGKYPHPKPADGTFASGEALVARLEAEFKSATGKVVAITTPNDKHGKGANFDLILGVCYDLTSFVTCSPSVAKFLEVVALFLEMKSVPEISMFLNMKVFRALLAGADTNKAALVEAADNFLGPDPLIVGAQWCMLPAIGKKLVFPASIAVPELGDDDEGEPEKEDACDGNDKGEESVEKPEEVQADVEKPEEVQAPVEKPEEVQAPVEKPEEVQASAGKPSKGKKRKDAERSGSNDSQRRSTRQRVVKVFGTDYEI
jgi:hypothetical protein